MRRSERVFAGAVPPRRRRTVSLTPLIDVVFILLIFFMLATSFDRFRRLPLAGADEAAAAPAARARLSRVEVTPAGWVLGGETLPRELALARLAARAAAAAAEEGEGEHLVAVSAGPGASLQLYVSAVEALRAAGIGRVAAARP